jgi:hypothetical protein
MARRLSQEDLAIVVQRAAELHIAGEDDSTEIMLDEETVLDVLREAGLSEDAAGQALSEWQRGNLSRGVTLPTPAPRSRLEPTATVARQLPIAPDRMADIFDAAARKQFFHRGRRVGLGGDWLPKTGMLAELRRGLDFTGTLLLKDVDRISLDVRPASRGHCRVTLSAEVSTYRSWLVGTLIGVPAFAAVAMGIGGLTQEMYELAFVGTPLAAIATGGGYQGAAHLLEKRREKTREALDVLLDRLS